MGYSGAHCPHKESSCIDLVIAKVLHRWILRCGGVSSLARLILVCIHVGIGFAARALAPYLLCYGVEVDYHPPVA